MRFRFNRVALLIVSAELLIQTPVTTHAQATPPVAKIVPHELETNGQTRIDNYYWLRDRDSDDVLAYLRAENEYTQKMTAHTEALRKQLFEEMKARIKQTDESAPVRDHGFYYYSRTVEGKQYRIYCRKEGGLSAPEQVMLDVNRLAEGHDYCALGNFEVSPDQKLLAYSTDTDGSERYTIRVKDLATGELLPDEIPGTEYTLAWANDNRTFFYTTFDAAHRPDKVLRHKLGDDPANDKLIYHEPDERFWLGVDRMRSGQYVGIEIGSQITSEYRYLSANDPDGEFKVLAPRQQGVEYTVDHQGDRFLIVTNKDAVNFKLVEAPVDNPGWEHWRDVIPHDPAVKIDGVDAFKNWFAVYERREGYEQIEVRDNAGQQNHLIEFPEPVYTASGGANPEYDTNTLRYDYSSLVTPNSVYDYNVQTRSRELIKRDEVLGGYDPDNYVSKRMFAIASDGVKVPISIVHRKDLKLDGDRPAVLYGYGAYGISEDPYFSSNRISLLDRGVVWAIAHVRGGGEMGRPWYEDGKFLHKKNTFTDFIACAETLCSSGYTNLHKLAALGGSAGGLLMGAITNMRPDLFHAVVAEVPFVDVVTTMLDDTIPLTVVEYEEWGNPHEKKFYDYMVSYSPYDNVEAKDYPNILITAGLNDPRVQYWEPTKWCAKLRTMKTDHNVLLLRTNMGAGHGGASGRYDRLEEIAFDFAFILDQLGQ